MATITVAEFATALDTTPREARKFLRSIKSDAAPGKGGRWAIEKREVRSLAKKFAAWADEKSVEVPNDDAPDEATIEDASEVDDTTSD